MTETSSELHSGLQEAWREVLTAMMAEAVDPAAVAATMLEVAVAARLALVGPRQLTEDLRNGALRSARLADIAARAEAADTGPVIHTKPH